DGDCSEYPPLRAERLTVSPDVDLYIYQDRYFVWLCYTYPTGSFATVDLTLKTRAIPEPIDLHVSAQLGEWPANKPELVPKNAESDLWWKFHGWDANQGMVKWMGRRGPT